MVSLLFRNLLNDFFQGEEEVPKIILDLYDSDKGSCLTFFSSGLNHKGAEDLTKKLIKEGAESKRVGIALFREPLTDSKLQELKERYTIRINYHGYLHKTSYKYFELLKLLEH